MPAPILPATTLDLTGLDRAIMLDRVRELYSQANPGWDDYTPNYPENLTLEGTVTLVDTLRAMMENRARQAVPATLTDRLAVIRLGRISNFALRGGSASVVTGHFVAQDDTAIAAALTIPAGVEMQVQDASNPSTYRTLTACTKAAGATNSTDVDAVDSEVNTESFDASYDPNQEYTMGRSPYVEGTVTVSDSNGEYLPVTSFLGATSDGLPIAPNSKVYVPMVDDQGRLVIRFGNGVTGAIPQGTITIVYETGGGSTGAVGGATLWSVQMQILDSIGQPMQLNFENTAAAEPGADPMTTAEARVMIPLSMRTISRCVTKEDFEYVAKLVPGVARAALMNSDDDSTIAENEGDLVMIGLGARLASGRYAPAASVSSDKLAAVAALLDPAGLYPALMGFLINPKQATFRTINILVHVYKSSGYAPATTKANIVAAAQDFFAVALSDKTSNEQIDFGYKMLDASGAPDYLIDWSWVFDAILSANGVRRISSGDTGLLLNGARASVTLLPREFPILGTVTVYDVDQGDIVI
jgi:hypothetical protein